MPGTTEPSLTIREAPARTGITVHTLRYYERIGLVQPVARARSGHRRYGVRCSTAIAWTSKRSSRSFARHTRWSRRSSHCTTACSSRNAPRASRP